jgi:hypothetical protein
VHHIALSTLTSGVSGVCACCITNIVAAAAAAAAAVRRRRHRHPRECRRLGGKLHGARASVPLSNFSLAAGSAYNLSGVVAAQPTQSHLRAQVGFRVADGTGAVSLDLLGGYTSAGRVRLAAAVFVFFSRLLFCLFVCLFVFFIFLPCFRFGDAYVFATV